MIEVEVGDTVVEFPDGTPPEVMKAALAKRFPRPTAPVAPEPAPDPTGSFGENVAAGLGKAASDAWLAGRQIVADTGIYGDSEALRQEAEERDKRDAALSSSGGGMLGQGLGILGSFALPGVGASAALSRIAVPAASAVLRAAPTFGRPIAAALRAAPAVGGGAIAGAGGAALDPVTQEGERGEQMEMGAYIGAALPGAGKVGGVLADRLPIIGSLRKSNRLASAAEKRAIEEAERRTAKEAQEAERRAAADVARQQRAAAKAEAEATKKAAESKVASGVEQLSGGQSPATIASALRSAGIKKMREAEGALSKRYKEVEAGLPDVPVDFKVGDDIASELAASRNPLLRRLAAGGEDRGPSNIADIRQALRDLPYGERTAPVRAQLQAAIDKWAASGDDAAAAYKKMKAVDRLFRQKVGAPRAEFGIKGTTSVLQQTNYPRAEKIIAALRGTSTSGPAAQRVLKYMPEQKDALRKMVGALSAEDIKYLQGPLARETLSKAEQEQIAALLKALKGG